jgi:hypothetical protein
MHNLFCCFVAAQTTPQQITTQQSTVVSPTSQAQTTQQYVTSVVLTTALTTMSSLNPTSTSPTSANLILTSTGLRTSNNIITTATTGVSTLQHTTLETTAQPSASTTAETTLLRVTSLSQTSNTTAPAQQIHCCCRCCYNSTSSTETLLACNMCGKSSLLEASRCAATIPTPTPLPTRSPAPNFVAPQPLVGSKYADRLAPTPQFAQQQQYTETLAALPLAQKAALGFTAADFILDCLYDGNQCNVETLVEIFKT